MSPQAHEGCGEVGDLKILDLLRKLHLKGAIVTLPHDALDDEIVSTFERINRLGARLDIFDLAAVRYYLKSSSPERGLKND